MDFLKKLNQDLIKKSNEIGESINKQVNEAVLKVRTQVSDDRNRFIDGQFNLDLSYITPRIMAMSYPSQDAAVDAWWRNSRYEVKKMLDHYHANHYLIINLTEKAYDSSFFGGRVHHIGVVDNHSPSLGLLLYAIQVIHKWLSEDEKNVVAIHCLAGLGRTGTLIVSYLLTSTFQGRSMDEALQLFADKRTSSKIGVKVPSQLRYIDYVNQLVNSKRLVDVVQNPMKMLLKSIIIRPSPVVNSKGGVWRPTIEVFNVAKPLEPHLLFSTKDLDGPFANKSNYDTFCKVQGDVVVLDTQSIVVQGDILIKIYHGFSDVLSKEVLNVLLDKPSLRLAFHTSFVDNYCLDFGKSGLDEKDNCVKSDKFAPDFSLRLLFSPYDPQQQQQQQQPPLQSYQQPLQQQPLQPSQQQPQQPLQYQEYHHAPPSQPQYQPQQPQPYQPQPNQVNLQKHNDTYDI